MKSPAILLYTSDFLSGCTDLTMEERGQYITLLCLQHQKGHLSEKTIRLSVGLVNSDVMRKFVKDEKGLFYNERMEGEMQKRTQFVETRKDNGKKGGRPRKASAKPSAKPNGKAKHNLPEDENRNESLIDIAWLKWKEYKKAEFNLKYKSEVSENAAKKELLNLSNSDEETAIQIIEQSIANGWKGFFKLKNYGTKKTIGVDTGDLANLVADKIGIRT